MDIAIIGAGYVGLVTGGCLAEKGHNVICVDIDRKKIDDLNHGICPIHEKGLEEILTNNIGRRLTFSEDLGESVRKSSIILICVGTPFDGKQIDLSFLEKVISVPVKVISLYFSLIVLSKKPFPHPISIILTGLILFKISSIHIWDKSEFWCISGKFL